MDTVRHPETSARQLVPETKHTHLFFFVLTACGPRVQHQIYDTVRVAISTATVIYWIV